MRFGPVIRGALHRWLAHWQPHSAKIVPHIPSEDDGFRNLAFTYAVIALSAKIACCDGAVTRAKYMMFRESFPLSGGICGNLRSLFTLACESPAPFEHYVAQVKYAFPQKQELFASLVDRLFRIATSDGQLSQNSEHMLARISHLLELPATSYHAIRLRYERPAQEPAHRILGVKENAKSGTLKKRYRELLNLYHPDRYADHNLSPEVEHLLQLKTSEINAAYKKLSKKAA